MFATQQIMIMICEYASWNWAITDSYCSRIIVHRPLQWRHNGRDSVSNHQPHGCLLSRPFRRRSKKISKLPVTGLCAVNSPVTCEFPAQRASNVENVSIWWRHHGQVFSDTGQSEIAHYKNCSKYITQTCKSHHLLKRPGNNSLQRCHRYVSYIYIYIYIIADFTTNACSIELLVRVYKYSKEVLVRVYNLHQYLSIINVKCVYRMARNLISKLFLQQILSLIP